MDFADRTVRRVEVAGKALCPVRRGDAFFAPADRCPNGGAPLSGGHLTGTGHSDGPWRLYLLPRDEMSKCARHG